MKKYLFVLIFMLVGCSNQQKETNYYFIKGLNEYEKENKVQALDYYKKAYSLDKHNISVIKEMAFLYAELGEMEKSKEKYKEALEINPYDENVLENILRIFYLEKNIKEIEKYSEKILDKNSLLYKHSQMKLKNLKNNFEMEKE